MPFDSALTSQQYEYLRGDSDTAERYESEVFLSVCSNTNVYTGRVNQSSFAVPLDEFSFDGGSGTAASVKAGMSILVAHTNDRKAAHWYGRIRKALSESGGAGTAYVNETGADIQDNDYFWIINDYAVHEILPRDVAGKPVPDVDTTFRQLKPLITGLQSVYNFWISDGSGVVSKAYTPTVAAAADGASISSYQWTVPSGATITVGSATDKDVTIRFDAGFADWIAFAATDSNGVTQTFRFHVWAHDPDNLPTILATDQLQTTCDIPINVNEGAGSGVNGSVTAFAGVDTLLDRTLVCAWTRQKYNGVDTNIGSASNILLVGRFRNEKNRSAIDQETGELDTSVTFEIEGPLRQLERLRFTSLEILRTAATPTEFNQVKDLTLWRAIWLILTEYSTFASLHQVKFDSTSEAFLIPGVVTQGASLLYGVADLCQSNNAVIQANAAGMCEVARRAVMLPTASRSTPTTVGAFKRDDYLGIEYSRDYFQPVGFLRGSGGSYTSSLAVDIQNPKSMDVQSPRGTPAGGASEAQLHRQVLTANQTVAQSRAELEQRAGDALAAEQSPEVLIVTFPDGYHWLTPDVQQWFTWTLEADETTRGKTFSTERWWVQSVNTTHNPQEGTKEVQVVFVLETDGVDGQIIDYPQVEVGEYPFDIGDLDDWLPLPPSGAFEDECDLEAVDCDLSGIGTYVPGTGWEPDCSGGKHIINLVKELDDIYTITEIRLQYTAEANVISPANRVSLWVSGSFEQVVYSWTTEAGSNQIISIPVGGIPADHVRILLYGDGDSCDDDITLTGLTIVRASGAYWRETFDFTAYDGGWEQDPTADGAGTWTPGVGWVHEDALDSTTSETRRITIQREFDTRTLTGVTAIYEYEQGVKDTADNVPIYSMKVADVLEQQVLWDDGVDGSDVSQVWNDAGTSAGKVWVEIRSDIDSNLDPGDPTFTGSVTLKRIVLEGVGDNPFR